MKEPWKKSCNGKVVITLNNDNSEKAAGGAAAGAGPTEVEVPVDLAWASHRSEKRCSAPKAVILMGVLLVLGLTIVTLFKVQNLVYSTTYVNWRMQELESAVNDNNDDVKLIKYKLDEFILDEKNDEIASMRGARAEPLVATINSKNVDSDDLKLSESQNQNHKLTNSLSSEKKTSEGAGKGLEVETKSENKYAKEQTDLNDAPNHPNPADPEEWIKPLVETFDIFGNQPMEDQFIHNVLMKLLSPDNNFAVLEFNKMQDASNNAPHEADNQKMVLNPAVRPNESDRERINRPLPLPIESILMKSLLPPISNFKVFHFNERPEQQQPQQNSMEEEMPPKMSLRLKQMLPPPINDIFKTLLPPGNMKIFHLNDNKQIPEQSSEEDMPKITIQSVKVRLVPLPDEFGKEMQEPREQPNFEVIRLNESPEPSQEVEAPKMSMPINAFNPFPIPIHELMKSILPGSPKNIEIVPLTMEKPDDQQQDSDSQQQEKFNPLPIPLQDLVMKTLLPQQQSPQQQESNEGDVEITKIPVRAIHPFPIPETLMKSMLPVSNYGGEPMHMINVAEQQPPQTQQQQQQQQQQQHQQQEEVRQRSTKLNPVEENWNMSPPAEPTQN
ncbi:putative uncharacterized protein DDB_G0271606 [Phymastichus coffea]|uniref:putative uncharacterized protein DDB_G0271606 n=1 Tax=Phymastichus coffea TaxID=108790 RepID=UPI00273AFC45|nr:putative uncharacterized protein DDB_G0271606 [Phymastichus coffea]